MILLFEVATILQARILGKSTRNIWRVLIGIQPPIYGDITKWKQENIIILYNNVSSSVQVNPIL